MQAADVATLRNAHDPDTFRVVVTSSKGHKWSAAAPEAPLCLLPQLHIILETCPRLSGVLLPVCCSAFSCHDLIYCYGVDSISLACTRSLQPPRNPSQQRAQQKICGTATCKCFTVCLVSATIRHLRPGCILQHGDGLHGTVLGLPTALQSGRSLYCPAAADKRLVCNSHVVTRAYLLWPALQAIPDWLQNAWLPVRGAEVKVKQQQHWVLCLGVC